MKPGRTPRSYAAVLRYLYGLQYRGIKVGLKNIRALTASAGHPERSFPCFHCAGTNGKGSTSSFLASILTASGYRTGLYTSPHLVSFVERIRIDGVPISERALVEYTRKLRPAAERTGATFFEITTCIAFRYFADQGVDVAVIETGLGGRLDATNVVTPLVSIITNIGIEHQEILGNTIRKIAREKAGIIKTGSPVVTGAEGEALEVFRERAGRLGTPLYARYDMPRSADEAGRSYRSGGQLSTSGSLFRPPADLVRFTPTGERDGFSVGMLATEFPLAPSEHGGCISAISPSARESTSVPDSSSARESSSSRESSRAAESSSASRSSASSQSSSGLRLASTSGPHPATQSMEVGLGLAGSHQVRNAELALAALSLVLSRGLFDRVTPEAIRQGLEGVSKFTGFRGRMELIRGGTADYIIDAAHNPAGIRTAVDAFQERNMRFAVAVFGAMRDKDTVGMLAALRKCADRVVIVRPRTRRAETVASLTRKARKLDMDAGAGGTVEQGIRLATRLVQTVPGLPAVEGGHAVLRAQGGRSRETGVTAQAARVGGPTGERNTEAPPSRATASARPRILIIGSHYVAGEALTALDPNRT